LFEEYFRELIVKYWGVLQKDDITILKGLVKDINTLEKKYPENKERIVSTKKSIESSIKKLKLK
jgi:hypothetical protein